MSVSKIPVNKRYGEQEKRYIMTRIKKHDNEGKLISQEQRDVVTVQAECE